MVALLTSSVCKATMLTSGPTRAQRSRIGRYARSVEPM